MSTSERRLMGFWLKDRSPRLRKESECVIERSFRNDREAHELLALIDAEFRTDPMSVQCFDLGVVERVRRCVVQHGEIERRLYGAPGDRA